MAGADMSKSVSQIIRPWVPNLPWRIQHVEPGIKLQLRLREHLGIITRGANSYEPRYVEILRWLIREGDTVFDVGANIGFYTTLFSQWVGKTGKVIAYEPDPRNLSLLRTNLESIGMANTTVRDVALASESGNAEFSVDKFTGSTGHLGAGPTYADELFGDLQNYSSLQVKTTTLNEEVKQYGSPKVLKLDIEGGEYDVLKGGEEILAELRPLVMSEMSAWTEKANIIDTGPRRARLLFEHYDYDMWDVDSGAPVSPESDVWMVLAVPSERAHAKTFNEVLMQLKGSNREPCAV
jgi:FkbM family methyltransferase